MAGNLKILNYERKGEGGGPEFKCSVEFDLRSRIAFFAIDFQRQKTSFFPLVFIMSKRKKINLKKIYFEFGLAEARMTDTSDAGPSGARLLLVDENVSVFLSGLG